MPVLSTLGAAIANVYGFTSGLIKDQYFNLVSLLLPGNGTNGKQNNAFIDSSTANSGSGWPITPNGDVTQGTFSPFSQTGWGNYFNGSANYRLTVPDSTDLDLTGDFCLEMWVYVTANSSSNQLVCIGNENAGQNGFIFYNPGSTTTLTLYTNGSASLTTSSGSIALNTWHHVALVRSGTGANNTVIYVDGVSKGSAQITTSFTGLAANGLCIGQTYNGSFVGVSNAYISNLRLVKGSPVYTGAFTPPTSPLTAITNTVLLTCQSNRFVDTNTQTTAKTITVTGSPSVTPFSPFAPTSSYSAAAVGGSGYFDGSGDYLSMTQQSALNFGTGNFTLEFWAYPTQNWSDATTPFTSVSSGGMMFGTNGGAGTGVWAVGRRGTAWDYSSSAVPLLNQWQHVAVCRSGTDIRIFVNGKQSGTTGSNSQSYDLSLGGTYFGFQVNYAYGYMTGLRANNTALYTADFSVPTAPLTAVSGTQLLLNFTNAGVVDATAKNVLETEGNAQISTAQSKWGGGSIAFDGTGDYLLQNGLLLPTAGDFTVEAWIRASALGGAIFSCGQSSSKLIFYTGVSGLIGVQTGTTAYLDSAGGIISTNNWYHVALTRTGNTYKIFVDGTERTLSGSGTMATTLSNTPQVIGAYSDTLGTATFNGYIDDLRISMFRRYTANFTAPTAPFPLQ